MTVKSSPGGVPDARRALSLALGMAFHVPFGRKPGLIAYVVAVVRATIFSYGAGFVMMAAADSTLKAHEALGRLIVVFIFVVFEELSRLGFVIRAENEKRAVWLFCACITVVETFVFAFAGMTPRTPWLALIVARAPSILLHIAISTTLLWGVRRRSRLWLVMTGNVLFHTAFNYFIPLALLSLGS